MPSTSLRSRLHEKAAQIDALAAQPEVTFRIALRATADDLRPRSCCSPKPNASLADKEAEIGKLTGDINEHALAADSHRVEIIALHAQVEALQGSDRRIARQDQRRAKRRSRPARKLEAAKRKSTATRRQERAENAVLRERINQIAAEIAHLTIALEGPFSPIESLLADTPEAMAPRPSRKRRCGRRRRGRDSQPVRNLSDRIRALQSKATCGSRPPAE